MGRLSGNGMSTHYVSPRDRALGEWWAEKERLLQEGVLVELYVVPDHMGEFGRKYPNGCIWLPKAKLELFFSEQLKRETNGQTVARLMREGRWAEFVRS